MKIHISKEDVKREAKRIAKLLAVFVPIIALFLWLLVKEEIKQAEKDSSLPQNTVMPI